MYIRQIMGLMVCCCLIACLFAIDAQAVSDAEQQTWPPQPEPTAPSPYGSRVREGDTSVGLLNLTDIELCNLQLAPAGSDKWTEDILSGATLKDGENIKITFPWAARSIWWDIRLSPKSGGASVAWKNVPAKRFRQLILTIHDGKPVLRGE